LYELNGEQVPSVSEISRFASREVYGNVEQYTLDNACSRGSAVHKSTEVLDKYGEVDCDSTIEPYIRAYLSFRKDYKIKDFVAIEKSLASEKMRFAGTIDRICEITQDFADTFKVQTKIDISHLIGKLAIIDIKSSSVVQKVLAPIQLNGYEKLVTENEIGEVGLLLILHLNKEMRYKVHNFEIDDTLFMSCYNLHFALQKKKRVKKS
jgi:hypothetical protein